MISEESKWSTTKIIQLKRRKNKNQTEQINHKDKLKRLILENWNQF